MPGALEYDEEDGLFDDLDTIPNVNTGIPIAGPSRIDHHPVGSVSHPSLPSTPASASSSYQPRGRPSPSDTVAARAQCSYPSLPPPASARPVETPLVIDSHYVDELRLKRVHAPYTPPAVGVPSLKSRCMAVCKANSTKIYDVGDTEYPLIAELVDSMPMEQLMEIEDASPHLRKDTDWVWELFLVSDYPAYHENVAVKKGVRRTSGWRRMYKNAVVEAEARRQQAADRVAEQYKAIAEQKEAKKIRVLETALPMGKQRQGAQNGVFRRTANAVPRGVGILGKLQADTKRERISMTHATGRVVSRKGTFSARGAVTPRPVPRPPQQPQPALHVQSTQPAHDVIGSRVVEATRLPAPRRLRPTSLAALNDTRSTLPAHLASAVEENTAAARAKNDAAAAMQAQALAPKTVQYIHKPQVENFRPPPAPPKKLSGSFFSTPATSAPVTSVQRRRGSAVEADRSQRPVQGSDSSPAVSPRLGPSIEHAGKRRRDEVDEDEIVEMHAPKRATPTMIGATSPTSANTTNAAAPNDSKPAATGNFAPTPTHTARSSSGGSPNLAHLNSVMFRNKKRVPPGAKQRSAT